MKKILIALSASALMFSGCFDEAARTRPSVADREFMVAAAQANLAAEDMGQLAIENGNGNSKWFGDKMAVDYARAQAELQLLALEDNVTLPVTPDSLYIAMRSTVLALPPGGFDKAFNTYLIKGRRSTIDLFQAEINNGASASIRAYASKYMPVLMLHHHIADSLARM